MPTATTAAKDAAQALPLVPFVRAAFEHVEPFLDVSNVISANQVLIGPTDVPAYGFARSLLLFVQATGGAGAAAVAKEDAPWSSLAEVTFHDVNGAPIVGPLTGYDLFLINKYGGYVGVGDPASMPEYSAVAATGNFAFMLRVPLEVSNRDALGALPNQNASANYKLRVVQGASTDIYGTNPTTFPTMRIRAWLEAWAAPAATSPTGAPQAVQPPGVGTTQMWSKYVPNVASGFNTIQLRRVGSPIRNLIFVFRNTTPARNESNFPDPLQLYIDSKLITNEAQAIRKRYMRERIIAQAAADTGVFVVDFTHDFDGLVGGEMRDQWLPTVQSTRLELQGTFGAAGTLTILTNDVAVVGNPYIG